MTFTDEHDLESHLRQLIKSQITTKHPYIYAFENKKAVDVVICRDGKEPAVFFLEVKLFQAKHGRLGIGTGGGTGYQPEIIARSPHYLETHLRWVIVDSRQTVPSFLFIPTSIVAKYLSGKTISAKFNNIQLGIFRQVTAFSESQLIDEMSKWLLQ